MISVPFEVQAMLSVRRFRKWAVFLILSLLTFFPVLALAGPYTLQLLEPLPSGHDSLVWQDPASVNHDSWFPVLLGVALESGGIHVNLILTAHRERGAGRAEFTIYDVPYTRVITSLPPDAKVFLLVNGLTITEPAPDSLRDPLRQARWDHRDRLGIAYIANFPPPACNFILRLDASPRRTDPRPQ